MLPTRKVVVEGKEHEITGTEWLPPDEKAPLGYYLVKGKPVPLVRPDVPLKGWACTGCGVEVPFPLEFEGDLFCSAFCAFRCLGPVGNVPRFSPEMVAAQEHDARLRQQVEQLRLEFAERGLAWPS